MNIRQTVTNNSQLNIYDNLTETSDKKKTDEYRKFATDQENKWIENKNYKENYLAQVLCGQNASIVM